MISRHPLSITRTTCSKNIIADNLHRQKVKSFKLGGGGGTWGNVGRGVQISILKLTPII